MELIHCKKIKANSTVQLQASSGGSSGCCCHLLVRPHCSSSARWPHPPHTDIQYKCTYYRKIVRSQCTLTYEKQSKISKEANHIYQKTQDTLVHQILKNCIHPFIFFIHMWNEKNVDKIQKQHSESESEWFQKRSQARVAEACGSKKSCRFTSYTRRVNEPHGEEEPRNHKAKRTYLCPLIQSNIYLH